MELVKFIPEDHIGDDGDLIEGGVLSPDGELLPSPGVQAGNEGVEYLCDVLPAGASDWEDVLSFGAIKALDIHAPAGAKVNLGDTAIVRGESFRVSNLPFDWSIGRRRPAHPGHRPRTQIRVDRGEVDG